MPKLAKELERVEKLNKAFHRVSQPCLTPSLTIKFKTNGSKTVPLLIPQLRNGLKTLPLKATEAQEGQADHIGHPELISQFNRSLA